MSSQKVNTVPYSSSILFTDTSLGKSVRRFRKGACKNCGAMGHKQKDCLERPRKVGAWKTGEGISRDETKQVSLRLSYEGSRDRWNGYDASEQMRAIELYNKAEEARKEKALKERDEEYRKKQELKAKRREERQKKKAEEKKQEGKSGEESSDFGDSSSEEEENEEELDAAGVKQSDAGALHQKMFTVGTAVKATVRNLRIREDTAKYLRNLDPNSAYYDPKSRSMRENPTPNVPLDELTYAGDNYVSMTGEAADMAKAQVFSWEAQKLGKTDGNLQSNPTQVMLERKRFAERKEKLKEMKNKKVFEKYGGEEFMKKPDASILNKGTDNYVEYSRDGRVVKGNEKAELVLSKYEEDIHPGNHSSVWGSYFDKDTFSWGYACCWQTTKLGYCTGEKGKEAKRMSLQMNLANARVPAKLDAGAPRSKVKSYDPSEKSRLYGEGAAKVELDPKKLEAARKKAGEGNDDSGKRKYNAATDDHSVTLEDMEVYRLKKVKTSDPMSQMKTSDPDYVVPQS